MKTSIRILAALAAVQVIFVALSYMNSNDLATESVNSNLLAFKADEVDVVVIRSTDADTELKKAGEQWQTNDGFPTEAGKVSRLLDKLQGLKYGLPVATSDEALERFKVADDDFERQITLKKAGDTLAILYVGSGAGARQSHVRRSEDEVVYSTAIGVYDLPADVSDWQDKTVLQLKEDSVKSLHWSDLSLQRMKDAKVDTPLWEAEKLPEGRLVNQQKINEHLTLLSQLRFSEVLGNEAKPEYGLEEALLTLKLEHHEGEREYQIGQLKDSEDYVLKVSDRPEYFKVPSYSLKTLLESVQGNEWLLAETQKEAIPAEQNTDSAAELTAQEVLDSDAAIAAPETTAGEGLPEAESKEIEAKTTGTTEEESAE